MELAGQIAAMPRSAIGMAKSLLRHGAETGLEQVLDYEMRCFRAAMASPEHRAAVESMLEAIKARKS
ncbi:MAG: hypothetical protein K9K36_14490, partial [Desulfarculaceae bacterium]|nr:hypothetical protein [Desulfarculaceae bacterium]